MKIRIIKNVLVFFLVIFAITCTHENKNETAPNFTLIPAEESGFDFQNTLVFNDDFNVYKYRNYYNGGGVAIGDIDNDGFVDIYMTQNQGLNKLYKNLGNFKFKDITEQAKVTGSKVWSTGVTMVDINADGLLDIYVCNSGAINEGDSKQNELLINQGNGTFVEEAEKYQLADKGFSTHASFFDYDKDGDLDVYLLNNSYQAIGSFNLKKNERPIRDKLGGDKLLENRNGKFVDVSEEANIYGSVIGFGLGVTVGDVNNDGWEDIYISNDFFERDYLYINQQDGTFKEDLTNQISSISGASMGADMADINNDGYNDIFVTEMLPSSYERLKTVTTFEDWNKYQYNVKNDYYHQFTRNTLQLNNRNDSFSEISRLSGVDASDWSWGALFFDMNNNGKKDLFIANGIFRDLTNQDYLQYISNEEVIKSIVKDNQVDFKKLVDLIPSNKVKNQAYYNLGDLEFQRTGDSGLEIPSFSNGAAYADLDNDGDLDLVVNNVNMPAFLFENNTISHENQANYLKIKLEGEGKNTFGIGAKVRVKDKNQTYYQEQQPTRGFQSSMSTILNFGLPTSDSLKISVLWSSGKETIIEGVVPNQTLAVSESLAEEHTTAFEKSEPLLFQEKKMKNAIIHKENRFIDFNRNRLQNHMRSTEGPPIAIGDVNGDGKDEIFVGGAKNYAGALYDLETGEVLENSFSYFSNSKKAEDVESIFFDADSDGDLDLFVASGGIEFSANDMSFTDRLYLNNGEGNFNLSTENKDFTKFRNSTGAVAIVDIDSDGDLDVVTGQRVVPFKYGVSTSFNVFINNGKGKFTENTTQLFDSNEIEGLITSIVFADLNNNGKQEMIVVGEFSGVEIFEKKGEKYFSINNNELSSLKGWWNVVKVADVNNDALPDLILGNHGTNSSFKASVEKPIKLYLGDYDKNGTLDPILTFTADDNKHYPYALRHNLIDQLKYLKRKYPNYDSFKNADIKDILTKEQLKESETKQVSILESVLLINQGNFVFEKMPLPTEVQFSPVYDITASDFDKDGDQDLIFVGNLFGVKPEVGKYDASFGQYLENDGQGTYKYIPHSGIKVKGEGRKIKVKDNQIIISKNNDTLQVYTY